MKNIVIVTLATALLLGLIGCRPDRQTAPAVAQTAYDNYVGSAVCGSCHTDIYGTFMQSGHPYKLTKVVNGAKPLVFPFTTLPEIPNNQGLSDGDNTLGPPANYGEVSYVIGGFKWKALFLDTNGFFVTGSDTQYNFQTDNWSPYESGTVDKPYSCGNCHTTGWIPVSEGGERKDDLPGMGGNFYAAGIQCEACHGEGAAHVNNHGDPKFISVDASSELCGRCHTRDSMNRIAASGGLISHHAQYDELLGLDPDNVGAGGMGKHLKAGIGCNTCHDPHKTTVHQDKTASPGLVIQCETCHADKVNVSSAHSQENLESLGLLSKPNGRKIPACVACHMPKMVKSAVSFAGEGSGPDIGDIKAHIFKVDLSKTEQFTSDGAFSYPWITAQYACKQCHDGVHFFELPVPVSYQIHTQK